MRLAILAVIVIALCERAVAAPTAEDLFNAGQDAYDHNNYVLAIDRWQASYRLSKEPALLFNIAQAHRLAGDCNRALASYRQFVAEDPTSERRPLADELARELEPKCGVSRAVVVSPVESSGRRVKVAGLVTGGAGIALVMTGLLLGRRAATLGEEVSNACAQGCDWSEQRSKDAAGRRDSAIGYALDGLGVAAVAAGAVIYYFGARRSAVTVVPRPHEGGAFVSWSIAW